MPVQERSLCLSRKFRAHAQNSALTIYACPRSTGSYACPRSLQFMPVQEVEVRSLSKKFMPVQVVCPSSKFKKLLRRLPLPCAARSDRPATNFGAAIARPMTFELIVLVWAHHSSTTTDAQLHSITSLGHPSEPQSRLFPRQLGSLFGIHYADLSRSRGGER